MSFIITFFVDVSFYDELSKFRLICSMLDQHLLMWLWKISTCSGYITESDLKCDCCSFIRSI